jgi:hypothetical protein
MSNVKLLAVDIEQWWSDWSKWDKARKGQIPWSEVPKFSAAKISDASQEIVERLVARYQGLRVIPYTSKGFVDTYSPQMKAWLGNYRGWYAQYPYDYTPVTTTWETFRSAYLPARKEPLVPDGCEADIWQFTGDKFYLPGFWQDSKRKIKSQLDVNFFQGTFSDWTAWAN